MQFYDSCFEVVLRDLFWLLLYFLSRDVHSKKAGTRETGSVRFFIIFTFSESGLDDHMIS